MRAERLRILFSMLSVFGLVLIRPAAILPAFDFVQASDAGSASGESSRQFRLPIPRLRVPPPSTSFRRSFQGTRSLTFSSDGEAEPDGQSKAATANPTRAIEGARVACSSSVRKNCSAPSKSRRRSLRAPSVPMPAAVFPVPWRCRSTAPPGRRCDLSRNRNWGHPEADRARRAVRQGRAKARRLARPARWRHRAASWRPDDNRACQPSGRARRRHLADADAGPPAYRKRAGGHSGNVDARQHRARRRSQSSSPSKQVALIKRAASYPEVERIFVHPGDQEGTVPSGRNGSQVARQSAALLWALLSFPCAYQMSAGICRLQGANASDRRPTVAEKKSINGWRA